MTDIAAPSPALTALAMSGAAAALARRAARLRLEAERDRIVGPISAVGRRELPRSPHLPSMESPVALTVVAVVSMSVGWLLGGVPTAIAALVGGPLVLRALARRRGGPDQDAVDRRVQEFADGVASALRGGQSIAQAVEFAALEARPPVEEAAREFLSDRAVGAPLQPALTRLAERMDTDESRLLALVLGIHHRAGGDVAGALEEVAGTIRHRLALRRELRALTAQGRISGVVLGVLPVGFYLIMALTSRGQMQPVLRSPAGMAMVSVGFLLDGLAFLWIRRLLRIEA